MNITSMLRKSQPDCAHDEDSFSNIIDSHISHGSVDFIKNVTTTNFSFNRVNSDEVLKVIESINVTKAIGFDSIPPKLVRLGAAYLCTPVTFLINKSIRDCKFPDTLKCAEVTPVHKKDSRLNKRNYRPVSVLPSLSKVFETILVKQLSEYFENNDLLSVHMSGFRKSHGCQNVLMRYVEDSDR